MAPLIELFQVFFRLGCTSFGGPAAHIGFFHRAFVEDRKWLSNDEFAAFVALCQFLPGPASSQVGFAIGYQRAGVAGAITAFTAFTLPSFLLLTTLALAPALLVDGFDVAIIQGLKVAAVAIVFHAVITMAKSLAPDTLRRLIAAGAAMVAILLPGLIGQMSAILVAAVLGGALLKTLPPMPSLNSYSGNQRQSSLLLCVFAVLLGLSFLSGDALSWHSIFGAFYQTGALVFGGGHVALPLLDAAVVQPGWVDANQFLGGYGAAQAVPGPMFTLASYLGAMLPQGYGGLAGAVVATAAIFLPGFLLLLAVLPWWRTILENAQLRGAVSGVNAAVVGVLAAALYSPIGVNTLLITLDWVLASICIVLLLRFRWSPLWILALCIGSYTLHFWL